MATPDYTTPFTLYAAINSSRAIMINLTFAMRGKPRSDRSEMDLQPHFMSITPDQPDQLSEKFLCKINPKGKVPVLVNEAVFDEPMPECLTITWYLCDWYPGLLPTQHEPTIRSLMNDLHRINLAALTFGSGAELPTVLKEKAEKILSRIDISEDYRKALEKKRLGLIEWEDAQTQEQVEDSTQITRDLCARLDKLMSEFGAQYILGKNPTALDAHVLVFLRRLSDVGLNELAPKSLVDWAQKLSEGELWMSVAKDGSTMAH